MENARGSEGGTPREARSDGIRFRPDTCPETSGQNTKKKNVLSILEKNPPAKIRKSKEHFFFLVLPSEARRWRGVRGAYEKLSHHTARGACTLPMLPLPKLFSFHKF
jgi:hypothetical protein